eukprot:Skav229633  [mRNA]  locus=scaffold649:197774:209189:- [translate_table: standard]
MFNFLDGPPEEEAPKIAVNGSSKTSKSSFADFLPMLSTAGLAESDSDDGLNTLNASEGRLDVLAMACDPPAEAFPGLPTHVILRVLKVSGLPTKVESKGIPGHQGLGFFLDEKGPLAGSIVRVLVTTGIGGPLSRADGEVLSTVRGRRCQAVALRDGQNAELGEVLDQDGGRKWQKMEMPEWAHLEMAEIDFQDFMAVDPELLNTFEKLGIPLTEQKARLANVAVDAVFDSESIGTTFQKELQEARLLMGCIMNSAESGQFERTLLIADEDSYVSYLEGCTVEALLLRNE